MSDIFERAVEEPDTRVVVIGGGVAGLVAARDIARPGFAVTVLESADVTGGLVASHTVAGIELDAGAESFATRGGHVAELLGELQLADEVVQPNPAGAWLQLADRAVPMPKAGILGIPSSPLASDVVAAIGWGGATRAYLDRFMPALKIGEYHNLGALVRRRMGAKVLDRLVAPVASGVYSADPELLDVTVVAPGLNQAITQQGSLSGAVSALRATAKAGSAVGGLRGGMHRLVDALVFDAEARGAEIRTGAEAVGLSRAADPGPDEAAWSVALADGEVLEADAVLLAVPAAAAFALLGGVDPELGALDWPAATSVELVTLVLDDARLDAAPRGTGMLVAADVPASTVTAKAITHATAKWAWLAEAAGPGRHVLRLSYGRAGGEGAVTSLDDARLRELAVRDAGRLLNIPLDASTVAGFARTRWTNALPFAAIGQRDRIRALRERVSAFEGLDIAGTWLAGTGLASVVPDARSAATRLRGLRWRKLTGT